MSDLNNIDKVVIGLGNPEPAYKKLTRHNAGKLFVNELASKYQAPLAPCSDLLAEIAVVTISGARILLCVPTTGMNDSGLSIRKIVAVTGIAASNFLLAYDALELERQAAELSTSKVNPVPGHNGLKSVIDNLPKESSWKRFARLKIRVGKDPGRNERYHYLVEDELKDDARQTFEQDIEAALVQLESWLSKNP
jgi:PTH1 family peptidyl-tRNA hydrolase